MVTEKSKSIKKLSDLVQVIFKQDLSGFIQFYDSSVSLAYSLASHLLTDSTAARQIVIETFTNIWKSPPSNELATDAKLWLLIQVRNNVLQYKRNNLQAKRRLPIHDKNYLEDNSHTASTPECELINEAIGAMNEKERKILNDFFFLGLSLHEVSLKHPKLKQNHILDLFHSGLHQLRLRLGYDRGKL